MAVAAATPLDHRRACISSQPGRWKLRRPYHTVLGGSAPSPLLYRSAISLTIAATAAPRLSVRRTGTSAIGWCLPAVFGNSSWPSWAASSRARVAGQISLSMAAMAASLCVAEKTCGRAYSITSSPAGVVDEDLLTWLNCIVSATRFVPRLSINGGAGSSFDRPSEIASWRLPDDGLLPGAPSFCGER